MGLEPTTLCLEGRCSSQLSYTRVGKYGHCIKVFEEVKNFFRFFSASHFWLGKGGVRNIMEADYNHDSRMPRALRRSLTLLVSCTIFVAAFYAFIFVRFEAIANSAIFPGARHESLRIEPESIALGGSAVSLSTGEPDENVSVLVLPSDHEPRRAILYAHGNGERLSYVQSSLRTLRNMGFTVVAYDYPGYGESTGSPNAASMKRAVRAAIAYIKDDLGISAERTVYGGYSLGSAAALLAAEIEPPAKIFLLAPFASDRDLAAFYTGFDIYGLFGREAFFENVRIARELDTPVFVAHGMSDATVPYEQGE
jgi:hypothetical protein